jgi:hypothetical protein
LPDTRKKPPAVSIPQGAFLWRQFQTLRSLNTEEQRHGEIKTSCEK